MSGGRRSALQTRVQFFAEDHNAPSRLAFGLFLQLALKAVLIIDSDHAAHLSVSGRPGLAWPRPEIFPVNGQEAWKRYPSPPVPPSAVGGWPPSCAGRGHEPTSPVISGPGRWAGRSRRGRGSETT